MFGELIVTGVLLGMVSSFHCVGMCGPIALSLPVHYLPARQKAIGLFLYNIGRIATYSFLGLIFGFVGRQVYLGGFQKGFSISLGILLILIVLPGIIQLKPYPNRWLQKPTGWLQQFISRYMQQKKLYGLFVLGAANGLLPCGMVYFAITGAMAAGTVAGGVIFMAAFGFGTFPAMFMIGFFGSLISLQVRNMMKKAVPYFLFIMGVLLILRGLNLNIPYISPVIPGSFSNIVPCH